MNSIVLLFALAVSAVEGEPPPPLDDEAVALDEGAAALDDVVGDDEDEVTSGLFEHVSPLRATLASLVVGGLAPALGFAVLTVLLVVGLPYTFVGFYFVVVALIAPSLVPWTGLLAGLLILAPPFLAQSVTTAVIDGLAFHFLLEPEGPVCVSGPLLGLSIGFLGSFAAPLGIGFAAVSAGGIATLAQMALASRGARAPVDHTWESIDGIERVSYGILGGVLGAPLGTVVGLAIVPAVAVFAIGALSPSASVDTLE